MSQAATPEVVLFDIDGTLISSGGAGAESWKRAFQELYGVPADIGEFTDSGMTDPEVGRRTFAQVVGHEPSDDELETVMDARQRHLPDSVAESEGYRVLDGVPELLARLRDRGILLGLTTGGTEDAARTKLARGELNGFFDLGGFSSDSPDRVRLTQIAVDRAVRALGREPERSRVVVVGDTPLDIEAAHAAGVQAVGVTSGHYDEAALREAGADVVLASLREPFPGLNDT